MDETLSLFVDKTGTDPSLARDLLETSKWDLDEALQAFQVLNLGSSGSVAAQKKPKVGKTGRGLSFVNSDIVFEARHKVIEDNIPGTNERHERFDETPNHTFILPDLSKYPQEFREFLRRDLVETSVLVSLEQAGRLNWWLSHGIGQQLFPLATVGDGNCLLHAASLGMWGFHDRLLTLRKALHRTLTSDLAGGAIKRRWRLELTQKNREAGGLVYSEPEWEKEWSEVLRIASPQRRQESGTSNTSQSLSAISEEEGPVENPSSSQEISEENKHQFSNDLPETSSVTREGIAEAATTEPGKAAEITNDHQGGEEGAFESLEEIHVFVLAHVLRRPIVIVADTFLRDFSGEPIAPIPFGGVYLPLECPPDTCFKSPLVLAFDSAHFSPLVVSERKSSGTKNDAALVPLVGPDYDMIPIHFGVDPGVDFRWDQPEVAAQEVTELSMDQKLALLKKYTDLLEVKIQTAVKPKEGAGADGKAAGGEACAADTGKATVGEIKEVKDASLKPGDRIGSAKSWLANQLVKVGTIAGVLGNVVHSTIYAARLQTNRKPEYYYRMIENYIESARERYEDETAERARRTLRGQERNEREPAQPCISPGCNLYGTASTSYLCSSCYKAQQKSFSETGRFIGTPPPTGDGGSSVQHRPTRSYLPPPSYSACVPYDYFSTIGDSRPLNPPQAGAQASWHAQRPGQRAPPSYAQAVSPPVGKSASPLATSTVGSPLKCAKDDCSFYGSPEKRGYCSSCFKRYQQTLAYKFGSEC